MRARYLTRKLTNFEKQKQPEQVREICPKTNQIIAHKEMTKDQKVVSHIIRSLYIFDFVLYIKSRIKKVGWANLDKAEVDACYQWYDTGIVPDLTFFFDRNSHL